MFAVVLGFFVVVWVSCIALIMRADAVCEYNRKVLERVYKTVKFQFDCGDIETPWEWRYDTIRDVSFNRQVFMFWKPLDSFFPNSLFEYTPQGQSTSKIN